MSKRYFALWLLLFSVPGYLHAQIVPLEGSKLNYRIVGFSVPKNIECSAYLFELAQGTDTVEKDFEKHIIKTVHDTNNRIIEEVPGFGQDYTWRVTFLNKKNKKINKSILNHFSTLTTPYVDSNQYKLRIIDTAVNHKDRLVLLDFSATMFDMKGKPVWFLPDMPGILDRHYPNRDLKLTATGTFTILNERGAFEFDYNGKLLWKAPNDGRISGDTMEHYHHEFTKLSNGHYMVAGIEHIVRRVPEDVDSCMFGNDKSFKKINGVFYREIDCGTLIEYDSTGNIIWSCKTSQYFSDNDFFTRLIPNGIYLSDPHLNSFNFDEENKLIYIGFRNISCILKIQYPSGKLLAAYGKMPHPEKARKTGIHGRKVFNAQHCVRVTKHGLIYLFNNNSDHFINNKRELNPTSTLAIFQQNADTTGGLTKVWEFSCDIDTFTVPGSGTGGSVQLLDNNNILACMGLAGRIFIVNPEKKIIWNAIPYYKAIPDKWDIMPLYRVINIETKNSLEKAIFR